MKFNSKQSKMKTRNHSGSVDLLRGRFNWSNEDPIWYKIVMTIIGGIILLAIAFVLKALIIPALASGQLSEFLLKIWKGRAP